MSRRIAGDLRRVGEDGFDDLHGLAPCRASLPVRPGRRRRRCAIVWRWSQSRCPRRLPARLPRHLRPARHRRGRRGDQGPGRSRPSDDARRAVHQGVALRRAHLSPRARAAPDEARRRQGQGKFAPISWDEALDDIAARLARDRRATRQRRGDPALQLLPARWAWCRARAWRCASSTSSARRCSTARSARRPAATRSPRPTAPRSAWTSSTSRSRLIVIWGSNPIASNLHFWTRAQEAKRARRQADLHRSVPHRHGREVPPAHRAAARHRRRARARRDARADRQRLARPRLHRAPRRRLAGAARARAAVDARAHRRDLRHHGRGGARRWRATTARSQPAAIRLNYGMQRVRGGGMATRADRLPAGLVGAWRHRGRRPAAVDLGLVPGANDAALQRPDLLAGRRPRTINMSTIGDDLLREAASSPDGTFGPKIEALIVYNSNPVAIAPDSAQGARGFARDDLFTVVLEHFLTDTADYADIVLPATTQLEHVDVHTSLRPPLRDDQRAGDRAAGRGQAEHRDLPRAGRSAWASTTPCFRDDDEALARRPSTGDRARRPLRRRCARAAGTSCTCRGAVRRRRLSDRRPASARSTRPGLDVPDHVANYESAASHPELARRFPLAMISPPARNFLNSTLRQRQQPARHRRRAGARDLTPVDAAARGIADGEWCASSTTAAASSARPSSASGRGRASSTAWRLVEEARQRRQERQRADAPAPDRHRPRADLLRLPGRGRGRRRPGRGVRRGARVVAWSLRRRSPRPRSLAGAGVCLTSGCSTVGYYAQAGRPATSSCCRRRGRCRSGSTTRPRARR